MKLEDIFTEWEKDTVIDKTELGDESLRIPKLHHKYFQILIAEKIHLKELDSNFKELKLEKYEFYTQGPSEETNEKGWQLPAKGLILKSDIPMYMEADKHLRQAIYKIEIQKEKIEFLMSIIKSIMNRSFIISDAISWYKFTMGA